MKILSETIKYENRKVLMVMCSHEELTTLRKLIGKLTTFDVIGYGLTEEQDKLLDDILYEIKLYLNEEYK